MPLISGIAKNNAQIIDAHTDAYEKSGDEKYLEIVTAIEEIMMKTLWDDDYRVDTDALESANAASSIVGTSIASL